MPALGRDQVSLKSNADEGHVELEGGEDTFTRTLRRAANAVIADGDPYLDDPTMADLFVALLESNDARRAMAKSDELRSIIIEPVDTEAITAEIDRLVERREASRAN
jgi:glutathione S-transferase